MIKSFRIVALFEGISYVLLLFIAVPIKYLLDDPQFVKLLGLPHGIWFVLYIVLALYINAEGKWSPKAFREILLASIIPFATFYIDYKYLRTAD
ncbi:MAG: DUF3817 domain-containing protein [Flavobacteriaceae bacterium]|nr:DUF3817 domain-containing protein [Bacteroidia bacterium]MBT8288210.1 DUF3817 domain-containing protein [Bacteroidia bacterium]NNF75530.1 DUF3817 domain-containing protein [Flavobacteriaceae bacterium]NNK71993.1 DUF3817 domain-containing protein [Flavobacteriaceae bacterium]